MLTYPRRFNIEAAASNRARRLHPRTGKGSLAAARSRPRQRRHRGGTCATLFFSAGIQSEQHGLFGTINPVDSLDGDEE